MRFNTVPDQVFAAINKEIDRYSSSLFMCKAKLFIAESEWMDTGIEGILTFVICRKLKSNVIRIYDEATTRLMFELELYEGISEMIVSGKQFLMIPFKRYCFCFLFENCEDSEECRKKIHEVSSYFKNIIPIPDKAMLQMKRISHKTEPVISGLQSFSIVDHGGNKMKVSGEDVLNVLYNDVTEHVAIKKAVKPVPPKPKVTPSARSEELDRLREQVHKHSFNMALLSDEDEETDELPPALPSLPKTAEINHLRPADIMQHPVKKPLEGPRRISQDVPHPVLPEIPGGLNTTAEKQLLRDNLNNDCLRELLDEDESFKEELLEEFNQITGYAQGVTEPRESNGTFCMIDCNTRGDQYDDLDEGYTRNVQALREYQRDDSQWGEALEAEGDSLHMSQETNVYVIDDADLMLREESQDTLPVYRPSNCTVIGNNRVSAYMPSLPKPFAVGPREYPPCSKASMMIMQDLDYVAEGSEDYSIPSQEVSRMSLSQQSNSNTIILPSVRTRSSYYSLRSNDSLGSRSSTQAPMNGNVLPPPVRPLSFVRKLCVY